MTIDSSLSSWLAQEQEVKARINIGAGCGVASAEQVAGKNGLEIIRAWLNGKQYARILGHGSGDEYGNDCL